MPGNKKNKKRQGVNRSSQIGKVRNLLYSFRIKPEKAETAVLNWFGIPGIGKTCLGLMIGSLCEQMKVPFVRIDFDPEENPQPLSYKDNPLMIVEHIYAGLTKNEISNFTDTLKMYNKLTDNMIKEKQLQNVITSFNGYMSDFLKNSPIVLLFDTTEKADTSTLQWVENNILSPLCVAGRCIIIWAGRFPQRWRRFEVRRKVQVEKLTALDANFTKEQVGTSGGARIYHLTFGYPKGNEEIAEDYDIEAKEPDEQNMLNYLVLNVIESYVLRDIPDHIKAACRTMSIVRQFDVMMSQRLLSEFEKEYFTEDTPFLRVIGELTATSLVEWNPVLKGYAVDETLRRILALYMKTNFLDNYLNISREVCNIYEEWIEHNKENRSIYIKEKIFHLINIGRGEKNSEDDIIKMCSDKIDRHIKKYYRDDESHQYFSTITQLYEEVREDKELQEIAGDIIFKEVLEKIDSYRQNIKDMELPETKEGREFHA